MEKKDGTEGKRAKEEERTPLSSSQELFEKIFKQATMEIKKEKTEKTQAQQPIRAPVPEQGQQRQEKSPDTHTRPVQPTAPLPRKPQNAIRPAPVQTEGEATGLRSRGEKPQGTPQSRSPLKTDKKASKRSAVPKAALLVILLVALAGAVYSYVGIVDISFVLNYFGLGHEQAAQAPGTPKQPVKPPEKAVAVPKQPREQVAAPSPSSREATLAPVQKEERLAEPQTPMTSVEQGPGAERIEGKDHSASSKEQPKPPEVSAKEEPSPPSVQSQTPAKTGQTVVSSSQPPRTPQYPYSVYLGSFKAPEAVKKAISEYQEKGLSPYWAKVELGDKGVWFRFFVGYFRTKEETEKFIRERNIQGATPGITKYANWIGSYESDKDVENQKQALLSSGFDPYVIKHADGKTALYSGAFDRKDFAEKERTVLASKGIRSEVVER